MQLKRRITLLSEKLSLPSLLTWSKCASRRAKSDPLLMIIAVMLVSWPNLNLLLKLLSTVLNPRKMPLSLDLSRSSTVSPLGLFLHWSKIIKRLLLQFWKFLKVWVWLIMIWSELASNWLLISPISLLFYNSAINKSKSCSNSLNNSCSSLIISLKS